MSDTQPLAYLITNSKDSLESYELSRLNRASNLRKEMFQVLEKWIDAEAQARMARSILDCRRVEIAGANEPVAPLRGQLLAGLTNEEEVVLDAETSFESGKKENGARLRLDGPRPAAIRPDLGTLCTSLRFGGKERKKRAASKLRILEQCPRPLQEGQPGGARGFVSSLPIRTDRAESLCETRVPGRVRMRRKLDCQRFGSKLGPDVMLGAQRKLAATVD